MPARRHHVKSRHGCVQCKARRTKKKNSKLTPFLQCDEIRPVCSKCQQRGSRCSFGQDPNTLIFIDGPSARKAASKPSTSVSITASSPVIDSPTSAGTGFDSLPSLQTAGSMSTSSLRAGSPGGASSTSTSSSHRLGTRSPPFANIVTQMSPSAISFSPSEMDNLRLWGYWYQMVWRRLIQKPDEPETPERRKLWQDIVPQFALEHSYLLHTILSICAVFAAIPPDTVQKFATSQEIPEDAVQSPQSAKSPAPFPVPTTASPMDPERAIQLADHHHALALQQVGPVVNSGAIPNNLTPLFLSASLIATYGFARACVGRSNPDVLGELCNVLALLRGTGIVIRAGFAHIEATTKREGRHSVGPTLSGFMYPLPSDPEGPLPDAAASFLASLYALHATQYPGFSDWPKPPTRALHVDANGPDDLSTPQANARAYAAALRHLKHAFQLAIEHPQSGLAAVPFATVLPRTVLEGVRSRNTLALALVFGWAVILHDLRDHWWVQDWGKRILQGAEPALNEAGAAELIAWPRAVILGERSGWA